VEAAYDSQAAVLRWTVSLPVLLVGFPAMHVAHRWGVAGDVDRSLNARGIRRAVAAGFVFAVGLMAWDAVFTLPRDMNVLGAAVVPYYLVGGFFVEVVLHLVPLALRLGPVGQALLGGRREALIFWLGAALTAVLEPLSQLGSGVFGSRSAEVTSTSWA
jgi:hypothetical protein